jgi:protein gp37
VACASEDFSDLFHEAIENDYIERVFSVMVRAPQHTYQILTKRHERMQELMEGRLNRFARCPRIWLGVSAENEMYGLPRVRALPPHRPASGSFHVNRSLGQLTC